MKHLFSWIDRVLRPKTTKAVEEYRQTVDRLVEEVTSGAARETEGNARFEQQTADYTKQIAEARRMILVSSAGDEQDEPPPEGGPPCRTDSGS